MAGSIDFDPNTLNIANSNGRVTGYIELPLGCGTCEDIDLASIVLHGPGGTALPITDPKYGFVSDPEGYCVDNDGDGISERLVHFERADVIAIAGGVSDATSLMVVGQLLSSSPFGTAAFVGGDVIRVTENGGGNQSANNNSAGGKGKGKGKASKVVAPLSLEASVLADLLSRALDGGPQVGAALMQSQSKFALYPNYPNPFNPETVIGYSLAEVSNVQLVIYNLVGQQVRVLVNDSQAAGLYQVRWDGRDASGYQVTSGVYLYRLVAGSQVEMRKMILLK
ncbi:MAG: FlgD immunoglobulin-like domain containing protein [Candidatus Latescibacteria bacterium]|nr:FlgD immunoglobulin-like domain containing protein [Candidatus Latescibacterota bacterium]